jgi:hypothetical protein
MSGTTTILIITIIAIMICGIITTVTHINLTAMTIFVYSSTIIIIMMDMPIITW